MSWCIYRPVVILHELMTVQSKLVDISIVNDSYRDQWSELIIVSLVLVIRRLMANLAYRCRLLLIPDWRLLIVPF